MILHTVKPGDSLWKIAQMHKVPYQSIAAANEISEPYNLVIGQSLYIPQPQKLHKVQAGESLWSIAQKYGTTVETIRAVNDIPESGVIYPDQILVIPYKSKRFGKIQVNAYLEPTGNSDIDIKILNDEALPYLTYLSIFSYRVQEDGTLIPPANDSILNNEAIKNGIIPMMVITNFKGGTFDTQLAHAILTNNDVQRVLISNVLLTMSQKRYGALNIDFERVAPGDRDLYTQFVKKMRDAMKANGYLTSVALAPKQSAGQIGAWYEAHDYGALGAVADFVIIMTYEWGWSGGPPLPVAPINEVEKVLNYAITVIKRKKIMMGMPLYGYDWALPYNPRNQFARRISPYNAVQRAFDVGARIEYDLKAQSPYFKYIGENSAEHIVWFEDARSVLAKFKVVNKYGLLGVSYWVLGSKFPQNWLVLDNLFNIEK